MPGERIEKRLETRYLDRRATDIDEALDMLRQSPVPISVGLLGNAAEILPEMVRRGIRPDAVTDQTSAHDPVNGYLPIDWTVDQWIEMRERDPKAVEKAARASMAVHVEAMLAYREMGVPTFDYGNNIRQVAKDEGVAHAFDFPGFVPAYVRPLFCRGIGPFRWAAVSGDPEDIYRTDAKVKELIPDIRTFTAGSTWRASGSPFRACRPASAGSGLGKGTGSASPSRDGRLGRIEGAGGDRPRPSRFGLGRQPQSRNRSDAGRLRRGLGLALAQRLLNTASGATWVSLHHGGGVAWLFAACRHGDRRRRHAEAARRLERVLWNDPGTGVMRHADAGYDIAIDCARAQGLDLPMVGR